MDRPYCLSIVAVAMVFGGLTAAAPVKAKGLEPTVDYSAERIVSAGGESENMRVFHSPGKERIDHQGDDGDLQTEIIRHDRGVVWYVIHRDKSYMELPVADAEISVVPWGDNTKVSPIGNDTVAGMAAVKYRLSGELDGHLWLSPENIPLKIAGSGVEDGQRYTFDMEQRDIRVAPQAASLFEIPAGYRRVRLVEPSEAPPPAQPAR